MRYVWLPRLYAKHGLFNTWCAFAGPPGRWTQDGRHGGCAGNGMPWATQGSVVWMSRGRSVQRY